MPTPSVGDVIGLKTGGPAMTVWGVRPESEDGVLVDACWFVEAELKRDTFDSRELIIFKSSKEPA